MVSFFSRIFILNSYLKFGLLIRELEHLDFETTTMIELRVIGLSKIDKQDEIYNTPECQQLIQSMEGFYPTVGFKIPWVGYFVFRNEQIVGTGSFIGRPKDGKVEIAYWTFKEFEGQGIASFTCSELINIALRTDPEIVITAKTAPGHNASTKILENNGFVFSEIVQDEEIGDAWLWVLNN